MTLIVAAALMLIGQTQVLPEELGRQHDGQRVMVRGRCTSILGSGANRHFRLSLCERNVKFVPGATRTPDLRGEHLEIVGLVNVRGSEVVVNVQSVEVLPSDEDLFRRQAVRLPNDDHVGWYKLALWAESQGRRYNDEKMLENAKSAYRSAVDAERRAAGNDPGKLRALKSKIEKAKFAYDLESLEHQILRAEFDAQRPSSPQQLQAFAKQIGTRLTVNTSKTPVSPRLRNYYDAQPLKAFDASSPRERALLARYWQAKLTQQGYKQQFSGQSAPALALADDARDNLAEFPDFSQEWLDKAEAEFEREPTRFTPEQTEQLAERITKWRKDPKRATQLKLHWLRQREVQIKRIEAVDARTAREKGLQAVQDAQGRFELAELYDKWFPATPASLRDQRRLLKECLAVDSNHIRAESRLRDVERALGRERRPTPVAQTPPRKPSPATGPVQDKVQPAALAPPEPAPAKKRNESGFRVGARADSIRAAPLHKARVVTKDGIVHQWIFPGVVGNTTYVSLRDDGSGILRITKVRTK